MKKIIASIVFSLAIISLVSTSVYAKESAYIKIGEIRSIFTDSPRRISISDPAIADISSVTNSEILIIGKSPGSSILNIWDRWGQKTINIDVYLENLSSLKKRIERLLQSAGIVDMELTINQDEDRIILKGDVKQDRESQFELLIGPFKEKLINLSRVIKDHKSVLIDVNVLELSKSALDDLGVDWTRVFQFNEEPSAEITTGIADSFSNMMRIVDWTRTALDVQLNFIVRNGKGKILSRPKLVCLSGQEAEFLVGGEVPVVTTVVSQEGTSVNVEYKEYGISLKIKPLIETKDGIRTSLTTEVSELDWTNAVTAAGINIPAFSTRSTSTEVFIKEGQTVFLAGLLKNVDSETVNRVPGLGDLPVLGHLFRSRDFTNNQTELVITLTPTIIESDTSNRFVSGKKEAENEIFPDEEAEDLNSQESSAVILEELTKPISDYARLIEEAISAQFIYPEEAREKNEAGTVVLSLYILSNGTISDVVLSGSSGFDILDASAVSLVKNITGIKPFPDTLPLDDLWIDIPIEYRLD